MMLRPAPESSVDTGRIRTIEAPVNGWNAKDSIADMPEGDAIYLDNFFPRTTDVILRKGRKQYNVIPGPQRIRTLIGYKDTAGAPHLFAGTSSGIYSLPEGMEPSLVSPSTNGEWQYTASTTSAGVPVLLLCNGVDKVKYYNGSTWLELSDSSTPALTGFPSEEVTNVSKFKARVIFCRKDSLSFYYLPVNAIAGAMTEFPLGGVFSKGGHLVATAAWTIDGGLGPDDYFIAITSEGEVAVYSGTDPSVDFRKVGTFQLPAPLGRRCFRQLADDLIVLTQGAIYPLSKSLGRGLVDTRIALSHRIERAFNDFALKNHNLFGWDAVFFPEASMLLVNVPVTNYEAKNIVYTQQFVMNVTTNRWCRFTNWNAEAWLAFDGRLFSALNGAVYECWTGNSDEGAVIVGNAKLAFNALGTLKQKQVSMVRPTLQTGGSVNAQIGLDVDYRDNRFTSSSASYLQSLTLWDEAVWNGARWNGSSTILSSWRSVNANIGRMFSLRLRCTAKDVTMSWLATDLIVNDGGIAG